MEAVDLAREQSYPTPVQNSSLLPVLLLSLLAQKHTPDTKTCFRSEYDYIVVGAGTAGSVVAARLSEDASKTVLLLEAGKPPPVLTEVPAFTAYFMSSDLFWNYQTVPQKRAALGHKNRSISFLAGKTVGGSSALNAMMYVRGNHKNYDDWAAQGAKGWSWNDVFPYFLKAEDNVDPDIANNGFHGVCGPMTVSRTQSEYRQHFIDAAVCLGYPFVDNNGPRQSGFGDIQANTRKGQRCSTAKGYLVPSEHRPNLDIVSEAFVTKILITGKKAKGVQLDYRGHRREVRARCEVIISAGTLNTPRLLMLSGIGPRRALEKFEIPVIADLPVGENFHNHVDTAVQFVRDGDVCPLFEKLQDPKNIQEYINNRTGPLVTSTGIIELGFIPSKCSCKLDLPDHHVDFFEGTWIPKCGLQKKVYDQVYGPYENNEIYSCMAECLVPKSRGCVTIRSADPYDPPIVDPNYFDDPQDIKLVVSAMKVCYKILESPNLRKLGFRPFETLMPGCEELVSDRDKYLECYARTMMLTVYHQVGTARMGDPQDPRTVVDPQLRVKFIERLRVVDASVIPTIPGGNPHNPVIMIAEKASDMIKEYHSNNTKCCCSNKKKVSCCGHRKV